MHDNESIESVTVRGDRRRVTLVKRGDSTKEAALLTAHERAANNIELSVANVKAIFAI